MQMASKYGVNNRVSPATVELLTREISKGKSLRQLFGKSHEGIRQVLAKYGQEPVIKKSIRKEIGLWTVEELIELVPKVLL